MLFGVVGLTKAAECNGLHLSGMEGRAAGHPARPAAWIDS
jgi:hypothetical protein